MFVEDVIKQINHDFLARGVGFKTRCSKNKIAVCRKQVTSNFSQKLNKKHDLDIERLYLSINMFNHFMVS